MQEAEALDEPNPIGEAEYQTLEQTLMESDRGRRFLAEFVKRNKTPETQEILSAIQRLEKSMTRRREVPNLDQIRLDIADMHEAIERTKNEIANIKAEGGDSNRFVDASHELDAIVTQTEGATQTILEAAEAIQEQAWILRENKADEAVCDEIDAKATEIFMACSFQDLTGQRTTKVVQVLRYLESRINMMINIWGIENAEADEDAGPVDSRPDAHLLNGPQMDGKGVSQSSVDDLFSGGDESGLDSFAEETNEDGSTDQIAAEQASPAVSADDNTAADEADIDAIMAAEETAADEPMEATDIDAMFDATQEDDGADEDAAFDHVASSDLETALDDEPLEDEILNDEAIDKLFDAEISETEADDAWEQMEEQAKITESEDPLEQLSEAERQALFN